MIFRSNLLALVLMLVSAAVGRAEIFIEHVEPPVVQTGKTTRVAFVGRHLENAEGLWTSLADGAIKATPLESSSDRAVFDLEVSSTAPIGVGGLRVATRNGLSNVHLFLVDDLPVKKGDAEVGLPAAVWGTFRSGEVDRYTIDVQAGQTVSFEAVASRFGKDADPLLTIRDVQGRYVLERDNDQGLYYDFRFSHRFEKAGKYTVEIRDARFQGSEHRQYVLRVGRFPAGRVAIPSALKAGANEILLPELRGIFEFKAPISQLAGPFFATLRGRDHEGSTWLPVTTTDLPVVIGSAQPVPATVPAVLCGSLAKPGERHAFPLELAKGQALFVRGEAQAINSPVDLEMILTDKAGKEVKRATDVRGEMILDFVANAPGTYNLIARDGARDGGPAHGYRITVQDKPFPPLLVAEVEGLTVPRKSYQPVPIAITRTGPAGPITLKLLGAPPGVKLTPDEIGEKDTTYVGKLEADHTAPLGLFGVQIVAETPQGPVLVRTQPLVDRQLVNVDLIPHALREDQRRLPPSVSDRLALQIVPPSPFDFEVTEPAITLPRYQHSDIPIQTTRANGFDGPIRFRAKGGQLADKKEGRTRVYAEFPEATVGTPNVNGAVHSKILANLGKARIEVTATGVKDGREVMLTRTFELNLAAAFNVKAEPAKVALLPGEQAEVRLIAERLTRYDGEVVVKFQPSPGIEVPETVVIPKGETSISIPVSIVAGAAARKQNMPFTATGIVGGYEEQIRGAFEIEIKKK